MSILNAWRNSIYAIQRAMGIREVGERAGEKQFTFAKLRPGSHVVPPGLEAVEGRTARAGVLCGFGLVALHARQLAVFRDLRHGWG